MRFTLRRPAGLVGLLLAVLVASLLLATVSVARPTFLAKHVYLQSSTAKVTGHAEQVHLIRANLADKHVRLVAASPRNGLGTPRRTVLHMARARHAVGGINAGFFDVSARGTQPVGGLVINSHLVKSPQKKRHANLYVTKSGRARIGVKPYIGVVGREGNLLRPAAKRSIYAWNSLLYARAGRITFFNSFMRDVRFHASCALVTARLTTHGHAVVVSTFPSVRSLVRRYSNIFSLVACGNGRDATWLRTQLHRGDRLRLAGGLVNGMPKMLVSGGRQLVNNGRPFTDVSGPRPYGANPLSFACVSANGLKVLLGVVDGRWNKSFGMSYARLAKYMINRLHCYDGVVFDGGGSTTMVAHRNNHHKKHPRLTVINHPSDGSQRRIATALLVVRR